jgi:hypothetical protein
MRWSTVPFGKYKGKTLPEIIVRDADWFFWTLPKLYGKPAKEGQELARKAQAIKIPNRYGKHLEVEYRFGMDHRFCGFGFVKAEAQRSQWTMRLPYLDLKLTKERCEKFFSNDKNFLCR